MQVKKSMATHYIPCTVRWSSLLKGIGKLYRSIYDEMNKDQHRPSLSILSDAAYQVGFDFGQSLKEEFDLGDKLDDIEFAMRIEHQIFGIESKVVEKTARKLVYNNYSCYWSKYFDPRLCIAIGEAEKGIAQSLNADASYEISQTRTMGAECCVYAIEIRETV